MKKDIVRGAAQLNPGLVAAALVGGLLLWPLGAGIGGVIGVAAAVVASAAVVGAVTKPKGRR